MPPIDIEQLLDLALQHQEAGRLAQAETLYRQILLQNPDDPEVTYFLGIVCGQLARYEEATALITKAAALLPPDPELYNNLGEFQRRAGKPTDAIPAFRQALALNPNYPEALSNLCVALADTGNLDEALAAFHRAIALNPALPEAYYNLGNAQKTQGNLDAALASYRQATTLKPNFLEAHRRAANILTDQGKTTEAVATYHQLAALNPGNLDTLIQLGNVQWRNGQLDEAIATHRSIIELQPEYPDAHKCIAFGLLTKGDFQQGWKEYEWRRECQEFSRVRKNFPQKSWDGSPLHGRTILLYAEQGLGDTIQFARYAKLVAQRGGRVLLYSQPALIPLLKSLEDVHEVMDYGLPAPPFDEHALLMSLPHIFATTLETIPAAVPYLSADPESVARWQKEFSKLPGLKVGITWQGNPKNILDANRSISLQHFEPLAKIKGVTFISLQKGHGTEQLATLAKNIPIVDLADRLDAAAPFSDTPAVMKNLDLVITIDTAICHLAGALAVPVWALLPHVTDWRWMLHREDTPWYPTMRLFRQTSPKDWESVIQRVAEALTQLSVQAAQSPEHP